MSHPVAVLQFHVNEIFMETFHMENRTKTMLITLGKKQVKRKSLCSEMSSKDANPHDVI